MTRELFPTAPVNPAFRFRPYQSNAIDAVLEEFKTVQSTLGIAPTGTGKTMIFSGIINRMQPGRVLVLADRGELIFQAAKHVSRTGLTTKIEKAGYSVSRHDLAEVVVASVQTMISQKKTPTGKVRRMTKFNPLDFSLIVCDEADCFIAPSHSSILNYFKQGNPNIKIFGCTATPKRTDEQALGKIFESTAFIYELLSKERPSAIGDGWLVPAESQMLNVEGLDFSHLKITAGDFNGAQLAQIMEAEKPLYGIAQGTLEAAYGLKPNSLHGVEVPMWNGFLEATQAKPKTVLAFTVSVKHAEMLADIFNRVMPGIAGWVFGKTPDDERDRTNAAFKNGDLPILCNCGTHTVGFDAPIISMVVPKPTASNRLYFQMIGRGTRPAEVDGRSIVDQYPTSEERTAAIAASAKPVLTILDFCGVTGRHRPVNLADVLGGDYSDAAKERAIAKARKSGKRLGVGDVEEAEEELREELEERKRHEAARKTKLIGKARFSVKTINPFDVLEITPIRERGWDAGKTLSDKQRGLLLKQGIDPDGMSYHQGRQVIQEMFRRWGSKLCTLKQANLLKRHGLDTKNMPMKRASEIIDALSKNGWRLPDEYKPKQKSKPIEVPRDIEPADLPF